MNKIKFKITPLFLVLLAALIICLILTINGLFINSGGGNSLGGGIAAMFALLMGGLLFAEREFVKETKASLAKIWLIELLILIVIAAIIYFSGIQSIG
jgi:hypothetical protein